MKNQLENLNNSNNNNNLSIDKLNLRKIFIIYTR